MIIIMSQRSQQIKKELVKRAFLQMMFPGTKKNKQLHEKELKIKKKKKKAS